MKKLLPFIWFLTCTLILSAQEIPRIKAGQITNWKTGGGDTVFVLNFWATWCAPCVAELPEFERLNREHAGQNVQVILVSNDFRRDVEKKLLPFVQRKKLKSRVVFMDETTPNDWIDLVSPDWSGSLPATLIFRKSTGFERFFEKQLTYEELQTTVQEALKH